MTNFFRMSLYTDSVGGSGFAQDWTIFYWGWWFALAPYMVNVYCPNIKGLIIRAVIIGMCGGGNTRLRISLCSIWQYGTLFRIK